MLEAKLSYPKFDMHIHAHNTKPDPEKLLADMGKAGIYGGCIFSNQPKRMNDQKGTEFDERIREVLGWTKGYEDRLVPVVWIHPYEDGIMEHIHEAVEKGVLGFKIICTDFYVYEDQCMKVLSEIAALNKPVFFHSGILWGGGASKYNRPLNWEALADIENLRFSMGHCSWPWHDECIALYGEFLNGVASRPNAPEMFFDLTPGTPLIYREDLLRKLFTIGYDVPDNYFHHNFLFQICCSLHSRIPTPKIGNTGTDMGKILFRNAQKTQQIMMINFILNIFRNA